MYMYVSPPFLRLLYTSTYFSLLPTIEGTKHIGLKTPQREDGTIRGNEAIQRPVAVGMFSPGNFAVADTWRLGDDLTDGCLRNDPTDQVRLIGC